MENKDWRFGVVANITEYHIGEDGNVYRGTKPFTPGTKVYLGGKDWDGESDSIGVIGRNRFGRIVVEWIPVNCLESIRAQRIFKPSILKIISYEEIAEGWEWWGRTSSDRRATKEFAEDLKKRLELSKS